MILYILLLNQLMAVYSQNDTLNPVFKQLILQKVKSEGVDLETSTLPEHILAKKFLDTYRQCEVQPPIQCFTQPRFCSPDVIDKLVKGTIPGNDLTNCAATSYRAGCTAGFWVPKPSPQRRDIAYPCCPGFFCLPNQVCMIPCVDGAFCRTSSWYCDNPEGIEPSRQCTPFDGRAQHDLFLIPQPPNDTVFLLDARQKEGLRCGGADTHQLCAKGSFCPDVVTSEKCPEGSFCREGSIQPRACPPLSSCPAGASAPKNFAGLVFVLVLLCLSLVVYEAWTIFTKGRDRKLRAAADAEAHAEMARVQRAPAIVTPAGDIELDDMHLIDEKVGLDRYQTIPAAVMDDMMTAQRANAKKKKARAKEMACPFDKCSAKTTVEARVGRNDEEDVTAVHDRITFSTYFYELSLHVGNKTVLNKASGLIEAGKLTVIMGASGSGKSSLLAALSGRGRAYGKIDGSLFLNSSEDGAFRRGWLADIEDFVAFVPQDDIMTTELSVEDNIRFSAAYRLDRGSDIDGATERVMRALELMGVRKQPIGDAERRGVSGGERKRVNIGMELVANPSILLLDEPTSGLDASAAIRVMRLLKVVARRGMAVVAVVHQPRREIFEMVDNVILLAKGGHIAYMGPRTGCLPFFGAHFASMPDEGQNPADFLLDMVTDSRPEQLARFASVWKAHSRAARPAINLRAKEAVRKRHRRRPFVFVQFWLCLRRAGLQWVRNYPSELLYTALFFFMGMLVGLLFQDVDIEEVPQPNFLLSFVLGLASMHYSLRTFGSDQTIYWREASSGLNRFSYFVAKITFSVVANVYLPLVMLLGFYGFAAPRGAFADYYWAVFCTHFFCSGLGFVISLLFSPQRAQMVSVVVGALMNVLSGFFPKISQLEEMVGGTLAAMILAPSYARWLMEGLFAVEEQTLPFIFKFRSSRTANELSYCRGPDGSVDCEGKFAAMMKIILVGGVLLRFVSLLLLIFRHRGQQNRKTLTAHLVSLFLQSAGKNGAAGNDDLSSERYGVAPGKKNVASADSYYSSGRAPLERTFSDLGKPQRGSGHGMDPAPVVVASLDEWTSGAAAVASGQPAGANERWCQALYDCHAERHDELSFVRGDMMQIIDDSDPAWWTVQLRTETGMIPSSYVRVC